MFALASWTGHLSEGHRLALRLVTNDADSALDLWSFEHTAIAIGLMPVFLIAAERLLASPASSRARRHWTALAGLAGLLVSWLHPWQGLTLLGIIGGLFVFRPPRRRYLAVATPVVATLLPLIYGLLLSRTDPSWRLFQQQSTAFGTASCWALLAAVGPLVAFAVLGVRRSTEDREWMLVLSVVVSAGVYFLVPEYPPHALNGLPLQMAVLAVRGWPRAHLRAHLPSAPGGARRHRGRTRFHCPRCGLQHAANSQRLLERPRGILHEAAPCPESQPSGGSCLRRSFAASWRCACHGCSDVGSKLHRTRGLRPVMLTGSRGPTFLSPTASSIPP